MVYSLSNNYAEDTYLISLISHAKMIKMKMQVFRGFCELYVNNKKYQMGVWSKVVEMTKHYNFVSYTNSL